MRRNTHKNLNRRRGLRINESVNLSAGNALDNILNAIVAECKSRLGNSGYTTDDFDDIYDDALKSVIESIKITDVKTSLKVLRELGETVEDADAYFYEWNYIIKFNNNKPFDSIEQLAIASIKFDFYRNSYLGIKDMVIEEVRPVDYIPFDEQ